MNGGRVESAQLRFVEQDECGLPVAVSVGNRGEEVAAPVAVHAAVPVMVRTLAAIHAVTSDSR